MRGCHLPKSVFHTEHSGAKKKGGRLPRFGSRVAFPQNPDIACNILRAGNFGIVRRPAGLVLPRSGNFRRRDR